MPPNFSVNIFSPSSEVCWTRSENKSKLKRRTCKKSLQQHERCTNDTCWLISSAPCLIFSFSSCQLSHLLAWITDKLWQEWSFWESFITLYSPYLAQGDCLIISWLSWYFSASKLFSLSPREQTKGKLLDELIITNPIFTALLDRTNLLVTICVSSDKIKRCV